MKLLHLLARELKDFMLNKYRFIIFIFSISVFIFAILNLNNFRIDASSDTLVAQNDIDFEYYKYYQNIFSNKNSLIIAIKSEKEIDKKLLNEVNNLSNKISNLEEVSSVFNINMAPILFLNEISLIDLSNNNYETIDNTNLKTKDVLNEFIESPIYSDQIINNKKNITSIIIYLEENEKLKDIKVNKNLYQENGTYYKLKSEIDNERDNFIRDIRSIINNADNDYEYYLGGVEMISNDVISFVKNDIIIFSIVVILLVLIILFSIFKKVKWVIIILSSSIFSVITMIGLTGYLNFEITAVSANFISLMFILSISMNIHILNNYLETKNNITKTLKIMFWPCFYTFLTTAVAFLSLVISDIKPIIDFGIVMIISLIIILISSFTIFPLLISFFSKEIIETKFNNLLLNNFISFSINYKKTVLLINFFLFILGIYGIINLNVENSFIKYFKKNTEIYQGMKLIDTELGGTTPLDIIIKFKNNELSLSNDTISNTDDELEFEDDIFSDDLFSSNNDIWFTNDKLNTIREIHKYLQSRNEIGKVFSIISLIEVANKINKQDLSTFELSVLYNEIPENYKDDLINPYVNIEQNMIKISARVKDSEDIKRGKLIKEIRDYLENSFSNIEEARVNGLLVLYNNMLSSLFSSQIKSLGFVIFSIFVMFIILFKSIKLSIVGIIPNIFAATYILGLIGLLNIPLDIMTITIAAISIGIAVDNTIHYLYRYKINMSENMYFINSINKAHLTAGRAVLITSLAISLGFLTLSFSNFIPTIIFGIFTSLAMIFAMIGVLITLPSLLNYLK